jgi:hypothetical protein
MFFNGFDDLVAMARLFAEQSEDDEAKIARSEHSCRPASRPPNEASAKAIEESCPSKAAMASAVFRAGVVVMSMHKVSFDSKYISIHIVRYILSQQVFAWPNHRFAVHPTKCFHVIMISFLDSDRYHTRPPNRDSSIARLPKN